MDVKLFLLIIALCLTSSCQSTLTTLDTENWKIKGYLFPDISLPKLSGGMASLADYRGTKTLVINFASW